MTTTPPSGDGADAERTLGLATAGTTPSARRGRTVRETSAGGLVVDDLDGRRGVPMAAIIGRAGRRGRMRWSLPKGHIEIGETPEQAAVREVGEETGLRAQLLAPLGRLDFWFSAGDDRVRKTVHHYLLHFLGGELCAVDHEVDLVAWVPLTELHSRLAYPDERRLAVVAEAMADTVREHGVTALPALPRHAPRRRPQSHSRAHL